MNKGKLIVFEGTDGSGKGTQFALLVEYLKSKNIPFETMDFPRYKTSFFGKLAGDMLAGSFGESIASELAVLPFACDRWLVKETLLKWLDEGKIVVSNRYTASSAVYHAAKLPTEKQYAFIDWLYKLEQEVIGLPHEDAVLYCHIPVALSQYLVEKRGKKDMYEENEEMQKSVERIYLDLATHRSGWKTIECMDKEILRRPEEIHKDILDVLTVSGVI